MIFKQRNYQCTVCERRIQQFAWDTDPPPICPTHERPMHEDAPRGAQAPGVVDDTVIGGKWCETLGHEPFFYTSRTELRREAERRGLENVVRRDDSYYAQQRKYHDQELRDTGRNTEY